MRMRFAWLERCPYRKKLIRDVDWNLVLEIAEEHGILGVLALRLQESDFAGVPAPTREKLQSRLRAQ